MSIFHWDIFVCSGLEKNGCEMRTKEKDICSAQELLDKGLEWTKWNSTKGQACEFNKRCDGSEITLVQKFITVCSVQFFSYKSRHFGKTYYTYIIFYFSYVDCINK